MGEFSELTKHLMNVYYGVEEQDSMSVLDMFDDDVVVIGTGRHEFYKNLVVWLHGAYYKKSSTEKGNSRDFGFRFFLKFIFAIPKAL